MQKNANANEEAQDKKKKKRKLVKKMAIVTKVGVADIEEEGGGEAVTEYDTLL